MRNRNPLSSSTGTAIAGAGLLFALAIGTGTAQAAVISFNPNTDLSGAPTTIVFGPGTADYTFSAIPGAFLGDPAVAVATAGTAQVSSLGGGVTDFFAGASIDQIGEIYGFSAFPTASSIPSSGADDFIGLAFTLTDGLHYGYAEVAGPTLVSYGYESNPGVGILTAAIPEPTTAAVLAFGVLGIAGIRTIGRRSQT